MLFFLPGSSGSGKTTIIPYLRQSLPDMAIYDFDQYPDRDTIGALDSTEQRQRVAEVWLQVALANHPRHTIVSGLGVMGEIFACPSAPKLDHIAFCLLDCEDVVRLDRIRSRGDAHNATMDMLCWAAWLRVHHVDPQWRQDVINTGKNSDMMWERWTSWARGHKNWRAGYIDTTRLTPQAVTDQVAAWVESEQRLYADGYRLLLG